MAGYGDDQGFDDWLASNGYDLSEDAPAVAVLRQRASDYLDGLYESRFVGFRADPLNQDRAWPRTGAVVQGVAVPADLVPPAVERASYAAALHEALNPGALSVSASQAGAIKRKKIDVIEKEFFEGSGNAVADATVRLSVVEGALSPYLRGEPTSGPYLWAVG